MSKKPKWTPCYDTITGRMSLELHGYKMPLGYTDTGSAGLAFKLIRDRARELVIDLEEPEPELKCLTCALRTTGFLRCAGDDKETECSAYEALEPECEHEIESYDQEPDSGGLGYFSCQKCPKTWPDLASLLADVPLEAPPGSKIVRVDQGPPATRLQLCRIAGNQTWQQPGEYNKETCAYLAIGEWEQARLKGKCSKAKYLQQDFVWRAWTGLEAGR